MSSVDVARLWRQAEGYAQQGQLHAAMKAYEQLLALDPAHVEARLRASRVALALGRYRDAHAHVMTATAQVPASEEGVVTLARALRQFNEPTALLALFEGDGWRRWRSAAHLTEMATLVSSVGENTRARELLDVALARDPRHAPAHYFDGVIHMFFGDMARAEAALERCIALAPTYAQAHWVLSRLRTWSGEENHVGRLRGLLARARPGGIDEPYLAFALHNELHDAKDYRGAWEALERGCRSKRRSTPHDVADARRMFERLQATCDADFVSDHPVAAPAPYRPVFIVGMHRSGSTLLEQLVAGHDDVVDGGETYAFTTQMRLAADYRSTGVLDAELARRAATVDYAAVRERFLAATAWRARGRPVLTEKLPSNFLNLGYIARALPEARILHMVRDPMDTCFSNLRTLFSDVNTFSYDQRELAQWFGQYTALMAHWHAVMPGRVLDVHYTQLVDDPEQVMRGVFAFCGLPWQDTVATLGASGSVATASSPQMRGGILRNRPAAWSPYIELLQPLQDALASH